MSKCQLDLQHPNIYFIIYCKMLFSTIFTKWNWMIISFKNLITSLKITAAISSSNTTALDFYLLLKWNDSRLDLFQGEMIDFFGCAIRQVREMCAEISQQLPRDHEADVLIYHLSKKKRDKKRWVIYKYFIKQSIFT